MSNQSIVAAIVKACDKFERGELSLSELQMSIEGNGQSLEGVSKQVYSTLHDFCNALEKLEFASLANQHHVEGREITIRLKEFLGGL